MIRERGKLVHKTGGTEKRWLLTTVGTVGILGLVCAMIITAVFAGNCYRSLEADLYNRASTTAMFFEEYLNQNAEAYYQSCVDYTRSFQGGDIYRLQFVDTDGVVLAASAEEDVGQKLTDPDIPDAMHTRSAVSNMVRDPDDGERIMALSSPVICSSGKVIGVLRYIASTDTVDMQILSIFLTALIVMLIFTAVAVFCVKSCIHAFMMSLTDIIDKAKRIANGSYGARITAKYDGEIGELADTVNELSMKISQNEKMQTEFISSLSHELRTPLTAITGWSETLLSSEELDRDTSRGIKIISGEAKRLTEMVKELLEFTRIQDGRMTLNIESADIRTDFEDTVYMYGSRLAQDGIRLEYLDNDEEIPELSCDPMRLRQVFLNILDNAAKHGGEGKRIEAALTCEDENVVIRIRDFGPGIPEDELPLVKHKFYKGSSKARGTGIGLAVCDEIVQMHGGILTLENAEGGGTLVTVRLPVN